MRSVLTGLVLVLAAGVARADVFWFTEVSATAGNVRRFDSATGTLGPPVTLPAPGTSPRVASTYSILAPFDIQAFSYSSSAGPFLAYVDNPYVVIVDTLPGSPTYNQVIQTINLTDASIGADNPGANFLCIHPTGSRIYVSCSGSASSLPSIRILRQDAPLPAATLSYSFTPALHPGDRIDCGQGIGEPPMSGEWGTLGIPEAGGTAVSGRIVPWGIDIAPDASKVYFACHWEFTGVNYSNVMGFTLTTSGDRGMDLVVTELPTTIYDHSFTLEFCPSTLDYASGGSRCYVTNTSACPEPAAPPLPPDFGFVMVINTAADSNTLKVDAGVVPPYFPPTIPLGPTVSAFRTPIGIAWLKSSTIAFVADRDFTVAAPATDGAIGVRVGASITPPGSPMISDKTLDYFTDPTPASGTDPAHYGAAVDNDDSEVVFCDTATNSINHFGTDGVLVVSVPVTPGFTPYLITCQSGTGIGGPPGGGGGGTGSSGGTGYDDNGADTFSDNSGRSGKNKRCGLTGAEAPILFGLWLLARRRSRKNVK